MTILIDCSYKNILLFFFLKFVVCIVCVLYIFQMNWVCAYLMKVLKFYI